MSISKGRPAWQERNWLGKTITFECELAVFKETERCEATSVDPSTAQRCLSLPTALLRTWEHNKLGFYAKVLRGGIIATGDRASVS